MLHDSYRDVQFSTFLLLYLKFHVDAITVALLIDKVMASRPGEAMKRQGRIGGGGLEKT